MNSFCPWRLFLWPCQNQKPRKKLIVLRRFFLRICLASLVRATNSLKISIGNSAKKHQQFIFITQWEIRNCFFVAKSKMPAFEALTLISLFLLQQLFVFSFSFQISIETCGELKSHKTFVICVIFFLLSFTFFSVKGMGRNKNFPFFKFTQIFFLWKKEKEKNLEGLDCLESFWFKLFLLFFFFAAN